MNAHSGSPPQHRINITLPGEPDGTRSELPFVIGVLADLSAMPERPLSRLRYRRFVDVELANLDDVLRACAPHLSLTVANKLTEDQDSSLKVDLKFETIQDFDPDRLVQQMAPLRGLLEVRRKLADLRTSLQNKELDEMLQGVLTDSEKRKQLETEIQPESVPPPAAVPPTPPRDASAPRRRWRDTPEPPEEPGVWSRARIAEQPSLLDQLVEVRRPATEVEKEQTRDYLKEFIGQVLSGDIPQFRDTEAMINSRIAQIDHLLSIQLREVIHHQEFQRLESSWRGIRFLLRQTRSFNNVKIRVLNITKKELLRQFERERGRFESPLARKVLDEAAGVPGAQPFSLLVTDFEFGSGPDDASLAERMARLGAAAHVPFLITAMPSFLGFSSFAELADAFLLDRIADAPEFTKWRYLRERTESRYLGILLPRMLLRQPYDRYDNPTKAFDFEEEVDGTDLSQFLWGSAVWPFAARQALDFERYGWFGAAWQLDDRGAIQDLLRFPFRTQDSDIAWLGPTEVAINNSRYLELRTLGLIPLCQVAGTNTATFFETWSVHKPHVDPDFDPPTTYESAEIDCVLSVSRIAHYLRHIIQLHRHRCSSPRDCEDLLRKWAAPYVVPEYARDTSFESAFPLLSAEFHIVLGNEPRRAASLEASLLPTRGIGKLSHPVNLSIPVVLPWSLTAAETEQSTPAAPFEMHAPLSLSPQPASSTSIAGRDLFIRRVLMAEAAITRNNVDVAAAILEQLAEQIERHHLEEWESPQLVTHVWDLLRRCYLLAGSTPAASDRSADLFNRICRLNPSRLIE